MTSTYETNPHKYNYAIVSRIPASFADRGETSEQNRINIQVARDEHVQLIEALRKCKVHTIELQEDEDYKDCCCVEDCAVVIGGSALITRPGLKTRQGETKEIRRVLKNDLKLRIIEITEGGANLDGGDVLFTGKEIFVGIGRNTNIRGAVAVANAFPEYMTVPISIDKIKALHLKSVCSMAGKQIIAISNTPCGLEVSKQIKMRAQYTYDLLRLDSDNAANMLYINGRLIHRPREEINETCSSILDEKILYPRHQVCINELQKARVTLSSLVLLVNKQKLSKKLVSSLQDNDMDKFATIKTLK